MAVTSVAEHIGDTISNSDDEALKANSSKLGTLRRIAGPANNPANTGKKAKLD